MTLPKFNKKKNHTWESFLIFFFFFKFSIGIISISAKDAFLYFSSSSESLSSFSPPAPSCFFRFIGKSSVGLLYLFFKDVFVSECWFAELFLNRDTDFSSIFFERFSFFKAREEWEDKGFLLSIIIFLISFWGILWHGIVVISSWLTMIFWMSLWGIWCFALIEVKSWLFDCSFFCLYFWMSLMLSCWRRLSLFILSCCLL